MFEQEMAKRAQSDLNGIRELTADEVGVASGGIDYTDVLVEGKPIEGVDGQMISVTLTVQMMDAI